MCVHVCVCVRVFVHTCVFVCVNLVPAPPHPDGLMSEGEFLDITEIKRHQAEEFECITNNGVLQPDIRRVKVTVNCESLSIRALTRFHSYAHMQKYTHSSL